MINSKSFLESLKNLQDRPRTDQGFIGDIDEVINRTASVPAMNTDGSQNTDNIHINPIHHSSADNSVQDYQGSDDTSQSEQSKAGLNFLDQLRLKALESRKRSYVPEDGEIDTESGSSGQVGSPGPSKVDSPAPSNDKPDSLGKQQKSDTDFVQLLMLDQAVYAKAQLLLALSN